MVVGHLPAGQPLPRVGWENPAVTSSQALGFRGSGVVDGGEIVAEERTTDSAGRLDGPFFNPLLRYDALAKVSIMVFRDPDTGAILNQIPSEQAVKKYRDQQKIARATEARHGSPAADSQ